MDKKFLQCKNLTRKDTLYIGIALLLVFVVMVIVFHVFLFVEIAGSQNSGPHWKCYVGCIPFALVMGGLLVQYLKTFRQKKTLK